MLPGCCAKLPLTMLVGLLCLFTTSSAQDVRATATVDSHNVYIGDWVNLHLQVDHPENVSVKFPSISDSLEGFEVLRRDSINTKKTDRTVTETTMYTLTAFDTGTFIIPPLVFHYAAKGANPVDTAMTSPVAMFVHGMGVDTTKDIKDIKPPLALSISFAELLPYILGILGVGVAVWLIRYILKKRKKGEPLLPEAPPRPAHELALEALRILEAEKFWQRGKVKEYHSQLTDIVRTYIERRYSVMAMEKITDEILDAPAIAALDKEPKNKLREILVLADLVKFAKFQPLPEENERSLQSSMAFVESTWRTIPEPESRQQVEEARA